MLLIRPLKIIILKTQPLLNVPFHSILNEQSPVSEVFEAYSDRAGNKFDSTYLSLLSLLSMESFTTVFGSIPFSFLRCFLWKFYSTVATIISNFHFFLTLTSFTVLSHYLTPNLNTLSLVLLQYKGYNSSICCLISRIGPQGAVPCSGHCRH